MKESTKKYFKLSLILYVVILCVAVVGTLAWFVYERNVNISPDDEASILAGKNVEICINDGSDKWGNTIELDKVDAMPDVSMMPNDDGTFTFWYPTSLDKEDRLVYGEEGRGLYKDVTDDEGYFIKIPIKIRANKALSVYLGNTSVVKGDSIKADDTSTTSTDAIAGAARVAFFEVTGQDKTLKTIWVPNEGYQFVDGNDNISLIGTPESSYKYLNVQDFPGGDRNKGIVKEGQETIAWIADKLSVGANALVSGEDFDDEDKTVFVNQATALLTFTKEEVKELEVYIWIEGTDRESKTALSGGSISYKLDFVGVEEKAEPAINIDKVEYKEGRFYLGEEDVSTKLLYSIDNVNWAAYAPNNPNAANIKAIRVAETKTERLGDPREYTIS